jgi:hypothetical protein
MARYGAEIRQANELPQFVKDIKAPEGLTLAAETQSSQLPELVGDLDALALFDLNAEGLGQYSGLVQTAIQNGQQQHRQQQNYQQQNQHQQNQQQQFQQHSYQQQQYQQQQYQQQQYQQQLISRNEEFGRPPNALGSASNVLRTTSIAAGNVPATPIS